MVTGDNLNTAKAIARECGILTDGEAIEGPVFRDMNIDEMRKLIPKLQVKSFFFLKSYFGYFSPANRRVANCIFFYEPHTIMSLDIGVKFNFGYLTPEAIQDLFLILR